MEILAKPDDGHSSFILPSIDRLHRWESAAVGSLFGATGKDYLLFNGREIQAVIYLSNTAFTWCKMGLCRKAML